MRTGRKDLGQIDFELKFCTEIKETALAGEFDTGLRLLQRLKMQEMNRGGMPACGLIYVDSLKLFFVTLLLRDTLPPPARCVTRGNSDDNIIDGDELYKKTKEYLREIYG